MNTLVEKGCNLFCNHRQTHTCQFRACKSLLGNAVALPIILDNMDGL